MTATVAPRAIAEIEALIAAPPSPDGAARHAAEQRNSALTKPAGALGRLEDVAIWFAGWRGAPGRDGCAGQTIVFAGNHGVAAGGVSAYPPEVTAQMVANFRAGGAAINQLCRQHGVPLSVIPLRLDEPTGDIATAPAMNEEAFMEAVAAGWSAVDPAADVLILGEMGIGNTTAATALIAALFGEDVGEITGRGAGVDDAGLARKRAAILAALATHRPAIEAAPPSRRGLEAARRLGGRELAAILGAGLRARMNRQIVLLDGLIATAALAPLAAAGPDALAHCLAAHLSAEPAHRRALARLGLAPLLDLGLRLGEGSGAAVAFGVLQSALMLHAGMATFEEAAVSGKS